ncbi:immunoglobulin superfamily member 10 isoform X2 [Hemicordylus capensis]|nr:immunoglobulin superfamily member 10 isoform X2 [Hemicordylus capensis]
MLHSNQIHTIQDRTFSNLHLLQVLKMSYNNVKVVQADTFHGLTSLVRLHMDHNQIEFVNPNAFYGLTSLRLVHLEGNLLKQLHADTFVSIRYLQIFKTSSIKHVYLSDNLLTSLPRDIFTYMSEIESIYLHGNPWICDCVLKWFAEWAEQHPDIVKCKKDRGPSSVLQCPLCANPRNLKGKQLADIPSLDFNCVKPNIAPTLKFKNTTVPDDSDFTSVSPKDFIAPIGSMILNMTDQAGNQANLACSVQNPTKMSPVTLNRSYNTVLEISLSTFLVCSIDYEHIQQLWSILALYSDTPLKLKRDLLLTKMPYISYKYRQTDSKNEELFTNIEAELRAEPPWLMQSHISLQLDRTATTLNTLHIQYLIDAQITLPVATQKAARQNWAMIIRDNRTRTEHSVLVGGSVELNCQAFGDPTPAIEWILADGSKLRAPYISEDRRITISKSGKFTLRPADNFDTGVYHCIGTNYDDADVLTFRITVTDPYMEHNHLNGLQLSPLLGETVYLPCQSVGVPDASVNWILPEHMVLQHSSRNKLLFHNGTLKIQPVTDRDSGYFKCVTANQYGVDFLVYQILVKRDSDRSQKLDLQLEDQAAEGSGNEQLEVIAKPHHSPPIVQTQVTSHASTAVPSTNRPTRKKTNNYREVYKQDRDKIKRRFRGHRRQFGLSSRKIDPLHWAALLEKTKKNSTLSRKQENATVKPTVKVLLASKISGNDEEMSGGDILPEEEFMLLATKRPAVHTLREATGNVVTAELGSISKNYSSPATFVMVTEAVTPVASPLVTYSQRPQKLHVELKPEMARATLDAYQMTSTTTESSALSRNIAETLNTSQRLISSEENDLHLKTMTPTMDVTKNISSVTSHGISETPDLFAEAIEKASRKSNQQVSVVKVSVPDDVFRHIYVYSTQKITTPQLPAGSTIVTHQQIKIVRDATTHTPLSRRYGRRRKISGRRRIVRPDRIPNIVGHRFALVRPGFAQESKKLSSAEVSTPTLTPLSKSLEQITSQVPISTSYTKHYPEATTVSQNFAFLGNKLIAAEEHTTEEHATATTMPFYFGSTKVALHRKVETDRPLQEATDTDPQFSIRPPAATNHSPSVAKEIVSTKATSLIKSSPAALRINTSPTGEILWHNSFGSNQDQKVFLELRLHKSAESSNTVPVTSFQTAVPTHNISPVHTTPASKCENQTDDIITLNEPISENTMLEKQVPTISLGFTELTSSAYTSSLTTVLNKETEGTSTKPVLTTTAHVETKTSKLRALRPDRRRGQRRRRPLKRRPSHKSIVSERIATFSKQTVPSPNLVTAKKDTFSTHSIPTELLSTHTGTNAITARLHPPIISTTEILGGKSTSITQISTRNTASINSFIAKVPTDRSSEKPTTAVPFTESSLHSSSMTTVLPHPLVTLTTVSTRLTQTAIEIDEESYPSVGGTFVQKNHTAKAATPVKSQSRTQAPIEAGYPTTQEPNSLASQTVIMPHAVVTQTIASPRWEERFWHEPSPKIAGSGNTLMGNTLTTMKSPQSSTEYTPLWGETKSHYVKSWSEKPASQVTTTTNLISLDHLHKTKAARPRIIGGKLAAFTVLANSDAFIPCEANGNPQPTIHWTKVSSGVDASKHKRDNRFEVLPNGTLSIQNVKIQDRGQYLCVAANQFGSDSLLITLSVVAYPPRILEGRSQIITVHSGKLVNIKCTAEGRPTPTIYWVLANKTYISESSTGNEPVSVQTDGTLIIKQVSVYDRGVYMCTASNPAGSDTKNVRLQVIAAPPTILEEKRQHILGNMGESLKLPCTAKGNPHPTVHWVLFDGTVVKSLQYISGKLFLFPNGTLYIKNIALSDSGNYECIATSSTGSERRVVILRVDYREAIPRIAAASQRLTQLKFGDRLFLNCSATGEPKPRIIWRLPSKAVVDQWHRMGSRIHVHPNGTLVIETVTEKDAGDYICVARNKMGDDLILMKVRVTMKPAKIDQKQYFKKLVPYGKAFKVDCKASGSPEPEITWSLPDGTMINNVMQADDSGHRSRRYILFDNGTLYFNKVGIAEEGYYTCYAQNTLGKDEMKVHITVVAAAPQIKQNSKAYAKVKAGDTALLDCEAIGEPKPKIFWLLPSNDMISVSTNRYFLHVNGSLSVTKVRLLDAGDYICVARNSGGDDTKLYKLEVVSKPPLINGLYTNKTVIKATAIKHSKKQIDCRAEGTPQPQIMWIMPDNIFLTAPYYGSRITVHRNGTLEIRNVRSSDTAEFICVARNDGGESILAVQLEVLEMLRRPMFKNPFNEKITTKPGQTTFLNCSVDGNPLPEIIWMLPNGTRLFSGVRTPKHYLRNNGTLVVYNPSKADMGKYRCAAKNKVGYIEKLIVLEVGQKPTIFIHSRGAIKRTSGETVSLHCLAGGSPKPTIIWTVPSGYVLDRPQINGRYTLLENGTLVIRDATVHDRGSYACKAQNYAGDSTVVVFVMVVAHPPRITNRPPRNIRTKAGVSVQLNCMALGIPNPEITWELPDHSLLSAGSKVQPSGSELHPQGTLVIQNPKPSDSGMYKCMAKNQFGSDSTVTYVQVI